MKKECNCLPGKRVCVSEQCPTDDKIIDGLKAVNAISRVRHKTVKVDQMLQAAGLPTGMTKAFMKSLCPLCSPKKDLEVALQTERIADAALEAAGLSTTK